MRARGSHSSLIGFIVAAVVAVPSAAFVMQRTLNDRPDHRMELTSASGVVSIANSREGEAILTAAPMIPGTTTTGMVQLSNTGDGDETLVLDSEAPVDHPGPGGGRLSERLRLRVEDISSGGTPVVVFNGELSGLHLAALGTLKKDEARTYRFVVSFPDGGANGADNAYQGSSASIGFRWTAGAAGPVAPPADAPLEEQIAGDAPEAYWPLDGSQSDMTDMAGGHTGTWANSITTAEGSAPGGGRAAFFNGIDGYGYVESFPAPTQAYTMEAWVKPATTGDMVILEHGGGGSLAIRAGRFAFRQVDVTLQSDTAVVAGRWQQVVGTWDASSGAARLYVDGRLSAEADATTAPSGASTFYIGRGTWVAGANGTTLRSAERNAAADASYFHGAIAQVAYFPGALTADRVDAHWAAGEVETPTTGPVTPSDPGTPSTDPGEATTEPGPATVTDPPPAGSTCPDDVNAQGGSAGERAKRAAAARERAKARAKALAKAKVRAKAKGKKGKKDKRRAKKSTAKRNACPGARAKAAAKARAAMPAW